MHEMSLCESVVRIVEEQAKAQSFSKVLVLRLEVGELAHVDPEALAFCFPACAKGGAAEGARLEISRAPGLAWCMDCAAEIALKAKGEACPLCGGYALQIKEGEDMRIKELEVE
jgi:hydrogenase nickel incorporation protein HypA/HybF